MFFGGKGGKEREGARFGFDKCACWCRLRLGPGCLVIRSLLCIGLVDEEELFEALWRWRIIGGCRGRGGGGERLSALLKARCGGMLRMFLDGYSYLLGNADRTTLPVSLRNHLLLVEDRPLFSPDHSWCMPSASPNTTAHVALAGRV